MDIDHNKYKVWKLPNLLLVHWILNPGLAFNELVLGQRMPKVTLIDKTSDAPLMENQYIPCPHCGTIHNGLIWSKKNAFGNWFGIMCPTCHKTIPCLWNITSLIVLAITFPIWGWFKTPLEQRWIARKKQQLSDMEQAKEPLPDAKSTSWLGMGFFYGFFMFCVMALPDILAEDVTNGFIAKQVVIWSIAGLLFGGVMKLALGRKNQSTESPQENSK